MSTKQLTKVRSPSRSKEVTSEIIDITPTLALSMLDQNKINRRLKRGNVNDLIADIKSGNWQFTGDPIRFDINGNLLDGQHRLTACVEADMPIQALVIYNLPVETRKVIDTGTSRNMSDILKMAGHHNTSQLATSLKLFAADGFETSTRNVRITTSQADTLLAMHPRYPDYTLPVGSVPVGISMPVLAEINYIGNVVLGERAVTQDFIAVWRSGIPSAPGCPVHYLRERIMRQRMSEFDRSMKLEEQWNAMKMVFNMLRNDKMVTQRGIKMPRENFVAIEDLDPKKILPKGFQRRPDSRPVKVGKRVDVA